MTLAETLKSKRKDKNITLNKLSEMTGLSVSFISDVENNRRIPSVSNLVRLATELEFSIDEIYLSKKNKNKEEQQWKHKQCGTSKDKLS